ncbi:MAG: MgtC/SapB family protein [Phycisphaerales bacterium]
MALEELTTAGADATWWEVSLRLVLSVVFAGCVGWERESRGRAAGLRTHMMVALGAAGFTTIALDVGVLLPEDGATGVSVDPVRIVAAIVGGIGFLGAGAIIQSRGEVKGLTTAAGLWVTAAIGAAAGLGLYVVAVMLTLISVLTLRGVHVLERRMRNGGTEVARVDGASQEE